MAILEMLLIGFVLALMLGFILAFILFIVYLQQKEDAAVRQFGRLVDTEVTQRHV